MENIREIVKISELRLKEANILFDNDCFDGSIYLAGYSVELLLKAKIAQLLDLDSLFVSVGKEKLKPFRIHKLTDLALYAGLHKQISEETDETFKEYWSLVYSQWSEDLRYSKCGTCSKTRAKNFIKAIEDNSNGIKKWIEEKLTV